MHFIIIPVVAATSTAAPIIMGLLLLVIGRFFDLYHVHTEVTTNGFESRTLVLGPEPKPFVRPSRPADRVVPVGVNDPIMDENGFLSYKGKPFMVNNKPLNFEGMRSYVEHIEKVTHTPNSEQWGISNPYSHHEKSFIVAEDTIAVVIAEVAGSACPVIYRILVVTKDSLAKVKSSTGCTAEEPIVEQNAKGQVVITTRGFLGPHEPIREKTKAFSENNVFKYTYGKTE